MRTARSIGPGGAGPWLTAALLVTLAGCTSQPPGPVAWEPDRRVPGAMAPGARMVLLESGIPAILPVLTPVRWPDDSLACAGSFVAAGLGMGTVFAVWRTTMDSGATQLRAAHSSDGGIAWDAPQPVGAVERTGSGCRRPPAAISVDSATGTVHVVYHGRAVAGTGVVAVRARRPAWLFGAPELIAKGTLPATASVAANADTVAVVFESPASPPGEIWLALSAAGRQIPGARVMLSTPGVRAFAPAVAVSGGRVGAAWNEARHGGQGPTAVARVGRLGR